MNEWGCRGVHSVAIHNRIKPPAAHYNVNIRRERNDKGNDNDTNALGSQ